jgi:hypothetical protein
MGTPYRVIFNDTGEYEERKEYQDSHDGYLSNVVGESWDDFTKTYPNWKEMSSEERGIKYCKHQYEEGTVYVISPKGIFIYYNGKLTDNGGKWKDKEMDMLEHPELYRR